jgi:phosphate-selective porin OprO/OprP
VRKKLRSIQTRKEKPMRKFVTIGIAVVTSMAAFMAMAGEDLDYTVKWKDGLRVESAAKDFKIRIGGRLQYDWTWASEDNRIREVLGELTDGSETRRARLYVSGTLYDSVDFKLQFDWATGETQLKDAYLGLNNLPVYLMLGHLKEPFSLEGLTSSKYIPFIERTPVVTLIAPSHNAGVQLSSTMLDERATWALGAFRVTDNQGRVLDEDAYSGTARITGAPWYEEGGQRLLHVGASGSYRNLPDTIRFRARPPIHNTIRFVDTRSTITDPETGEEKTIDILGQDALLYGVESALMLGPLSLQGEMLGASIDVDAGSDVEPYGWYAQVSYLLTGEHRPYKRSKGTFSAVKPEASYGKGGNGAWELAARYDWLDLTDAEAVDGKLTDTSLGINWYLNPAVRLAANYIYTDREDLGTVDFVGFRAQVVF